MKKTILLVAAFAITLFSNATAHAQTGTISTVAGCNFCVLTPIDGVTATLAEFFESSGIALDTARNVYIADRGISKVRRVLSSSNLVYTVAGDGTTGFSGDGGPATAARLNKPVGICIDGGNNILYVADEGNSRVRMVNLTTNIITTVAGGGSATADGVPATTAVIAPKCVFADAAGNIYTGGINKLKKINAAGIITTIAGDGTGVDAGDGGPATAASIAGPIQSIAMDATGNIYFVSNARNTVRKIDAITGIITTVVGGGACPATSISSCGVDIAGNIITIDRANRVIRRFDKANNVAYTIAGGGTMVAEGAPAMSAYVRGYQMYMDNSGGNIYFTDSLFWIRKMAYNPASYTGFGRSSFSTSINKLCSGPKLTMNTVTYSAGMSIKTWFGDGQTNTIAVSSDCSGIYGIAEITHVYANSGTYTIKQVMYNGTMAVDSMHRTYQHALCNSIYVQYYHDADGDCLKNSNEPNIFMPTLTQIDSNGIPVDTISVTSGAYYTAYGNSGDIYKFKPIGLVPGLIAVCPSGGFVADTLKPIVYNTSPSMIGLACSSVPGYDLRVFPSFRVGSHAFRGTIIVDNTLCTPKNGTLKMQMSPKYNVSFYSRPDETSIAGNVVSWNIDTLSSIMHKPQKISVDISSATAHLFGDTVITRYNIDPISADIAPPNNIVIRCDTVSASFDPNDISVVPGNGCVYSGNKLTYTVRFENTGTDTAFNIHVMDTLSDNLNLETMRIITASHRMDVIPIHAGGYNILKFDFPDINLLDSSHHGENDGMFIYSIDVKNSLPDGTQIPNRAGIYFDYNPVVLTNTVVNTIGCPTGVPEVTGNNNVALFPNPATNTLTIKMNDGAYSSCTISNTLGQVAMQQQLNGTLTNISVAALPSGMYYVTLHGEQENKVLKFVKQ